MSLSECRSNRHSRSGGRRAGSAGAILYHPRRLLLGRQASLWGKLINQVRQILTQASKQLVPAQPGLLAQRVERIAAERIRQILGRDVLVRAGADPGLRDAAVSAVLQFFYDVPEAAAQHAARRGAAAAPPSTVPNPPGKRSLRLPPGLAPVAVPLGLLPGLPPSNPPRISPRSPPEPPALIVPPGGSRPVWPTPPEGAA